MTFREFWLSIKIPPVLSSRGQWDAMHSVALKAYNAGRKAERERLCKTK